MSGYGVKPDGGYYCVDSSSQCEAGDVFVTDISQSAPVLMAKKMTEFTDAYFAAAYADISFTTAGGVTANFQANETSQALILKTAGSYSRRGAVPNGFTWTASDNTRVTFTLADLNGLYDVILDRGEPLFQHLQDLKAQARAIVANASLTDADKITQIKTVKW